MFVALCSILFDPITSIALLKMIVDLFFIFHVATMFIIESIKYFDIHKMILIFKHIGLKLCFSFLDILVLKMVTGFTEILTHF